MFCVIADKIILCNYTSGESGLRDYQPEMTVMFLSCLKGLRFFFLLLF